MKMETLAVQQLYRPSDFTSLGSNKVKDWSTTLTPPLTAATKAATNLPYTHSNITNSMKTSININHKMNRTAEVLSKHTSRIRATTTMNATNATNATRKKDATFYNGNDSDTAAVNELSLRLLSELKSAKSRHLSCTEVSLPCDLTTRIAAEILCLSEREPCGLRGCTIYIEFEDEPNNSRRIASLKLDMETVSTFELYLTLRQDHRGWAALLPHFMKSLSRTITISPEFTVTKNKLYSPLGNNNYSYNASKSISTRIA
uniref:Protein scylla n=1 Tax=Glossina austeni TaxID=7395 RepID=A0A1A9UPE0_GLOAU